jgi:hypothetical protein
MVASVTLAPSLILGQLLIEIEEITMGLRVIRGAFLVGVLAIVVLVLAFFLVPAIMADLPLISQLGNVDEAKPPDLHKCFLYDPTADVEPPDTGVTLETTDVHIVDSMFEEHPDWFPHVNALMRCEAQIDNWVGPAFQISGNDFDSTINCVVALEPDNADDPPNPHFKFTTNWNQTISSSGNAVLSCRFKK